jgi:HIRAN domain
MNGISDEQFEATIKANFAKFNLEKQFYAKVVGASHANSDGSSRVRIIRRCEVGDALELRPEPENPFDANAMAICRRDTGEQLGYLEARLASEVARDFQRYGPCWAALFRHHDHHPDTGAVVGAVIYMMRMPVEQLAAEDSAVSQST